MKLKIGKRNIKTAIAVVLSMLVSKAFKLEYPFFTVIAAIFSMENSIANSYKAGLYRLIGTVVGASAGVLFVWIQPGNALLMGLGTLTLIFVCNTFRWDRAVPIAGVVFASVMLSLNNKNPIQYSFSRVLDTFIGIVIAVAVNKIVFPPDNLALIRKRLDEISARIKEVVRDSLCFHTNTDIHDVRAEIVDAIRFLESYKEEFKPVEGKGTEYAAVGERLESLRGILAHLKTIDELGSECRLSRENTDRMKALELCDNSSAGDHENELNTVYNYHVKRILETLPRPASSEDG